MPTILAANIGPGTLDSDTPTTDVDITSDAALTPAIGPVGNAADVASLPNNGGQISVYTVRSGDTLGSIAAMFGVTKATILASNNLTSASQIKTGMTLVILPISGHMYTVAKGDTTAGIAKKFKVDAADIEEWNDMAPGEAVSAGDTLIIPDPGFTSLPSSGNNGKSSGSKQSGGGHVPVTLIAGNGGFDVSDILIRPLTGDCPITQKLHGARHSGIDIGCPTGTPIKAAATGTVIVAITSGYNTGYGEYVVVSHTYGGRTFQTLYAHMSKVFVSVGETVTQGQVIGDVGRTGRATGSHLHFEVNGAENPLANPDFGL